MEFVEYSNEEPLLGKWMEENMLFLALVDHVSRMVCCTAVAVGQTVG